jgi:SAM-dependent methyltransferase
MTEVNDVNVQTRDPRSLDALVGRVFGDFAAGMTLPLVRMGDRLGLYRALEGGQSTAQELADRTGVSVPFVREWLANQAAAGYVDVDLERESFSLSPEQAAVFADEDSGVNMQAAFELASAYTRSAPRLVDAIRSSRDYRWGDHDPELFDAVERFYRPAYATALVPEWIPALPGATERLREGAVVADVGCGHGWSTVLLAEAFPRSRFVGIDDHPGSIERARRLAVEHGVGDRISFQVRPAIELEGTFDLIVVLDALHDMGEPQRVAARLNDHLKDTGACLIVEPFAGDHLADNLTPLGRVYYAASTLNCVPSALSQGDSRPLGAQAGPARLIATLSNGGFSMVRIAVTTPFNLVLDARP